MDSNRGRNIFGDITFGKCEYHHVIRTNNVIVYQKFEGISGYYSGSEYLGANSKAGRTNIIKDYPQYSWLIIGSRSVFVKNVTMSGKKQKAL